MGKLKKTELVQERLTTYCDRQNKLSQENNFKNREYSENQKE